MVSQPWGQHGSEGFQCVLVTRPRGSSDLSNHGDRSWLIIPSTLPRPAPPSLPQLPLQMAVVPLAPVEAGCQEAGYTREKDG